MRFSKIFLLLLPLSLVACNHNNPVEPEKPDPTLPTTPLCLTCTSSDVDALIEVFHSSTDLMDDFSLQYSRDNRTWHDIELIYRQQTFILKEGETIYFRGDNPEGFSKGYINEEGEIIPERLTMIAATSGFVEIGGNVMSLLSSTNFDGLTDIPCDYCFAMLFSNYESPSYYSDASELLLPATKLKEGCYANMFMENEALKYAPILPATDLVKNCYYHMFEKCTNLKKLQVAFDGTAFVKDSSSDKYLYTDTWLEESIGGDIPVFIWPGTIGTTERNVSTIPSSWNVKAPEEVL